MAYLVDSVAFRCDYDFLNYFLLLFFCFFALFCLSFFFLFCCLNKISCYYLRSFQFVFNAERIFFCFKDSSVTGFVIIEKFCNILFPFQHWNYISIDVAMSSSPLAAITSCKILIIEIAKDSMMTSIKNKKN